jgi:hypothetical protein
LGCSNELAASACRYLFTFILSYVKYANATIFL